MKKTEVIVKLSKGEIQIEVDNNNIELLNECFKDIIDKSSRLIGVYKYYWNINCSDESNKDRKIIKLSEIES